MKIDLSRYAPPGINLNPEKNVFLWGLAGAACWSLSFLFRLYEKRDALFQRIGNENVLRAGAVMPDYTEVLGSALIGFAVLALAMLAFLVYHYAYHRQGSKCIYLMRRLPDRRELHRRCLTIPLVSVLLCALAAFILLCVYYWIYIAVTPDVCLVPGQWQKIWRLTI